MQAELKNLDNQYQDDDMDSEGSEEIEEPKIQRDDLRNPFWIEDKEVLNGPRGHLKMDEIDFWKGKKEVERYLIRLRDFYLGLLCTTF